MSAAFFRFLRANEALRRSFGSALDLMFPRHCACCGGDVGDAARYVCWDCRSAIKLILAPFCAICGNPFEGAVAAGSICAFCLRRAPYYDQARSVARFAGVLRDLVHAFKYQGAIWLQDDLGLLLRGGYAVHYSASALDLITFVPLHHVRERERSYNQAGLLARILARQFGLEMWRGLRRARATCSQTNLNSAQRAANVKNIFEVTDVKVLQGRRVLLVDDVMTTGATVNECARMLKQSGAKAVFVLTVGRG